ncbi:MAG: diacylglycerol kinase family protein [bacterium]|nr:diacylglycerol kinase family protein [bacterium]
MTAPDAPVSFRKIALIYNPLSGSSRDRRIALVKRIQKVFMLKTPIVELVSTHSKGSAGNQAMDMIADGYEAMIACGGDGTVHDIVQEMVRQKTPVPLGVIPMGTGNMLATEIGMPPDPYIASAALLDARLLRIAVGQVAYTPLEALPTEQMQSVRYFVIGAGIGIDAKLMRITSSTMKERYGNAAYYAAMARLLWRREFTPFLSHYATTNGDDHYTTSTQMLAMRVRNMGARMRHFAPGASLRKNSFRCIIGNGKNPAGYLRYFLKAATGWDVSTPDFAAYDVADVHCTPLKDQDHIAYVQADGELLGRLPAEFHIMPEALTLLVPAHGML